MKQVEEIEVVMLYVKPKLQWFMFSVETGGHLQEYMDCENIRKRFADLKETGRNYYRITIERINK